MTLRSLFLILFILIIAVIDAKTFKIPNCLLFPCFLFLLAFDVLCSFNFFLFINNMASVFIWFLIFYLVYRFRGGIGFGDVKYAAFLGYALGLEKSCAAFLYTALAAITVYAVGTVVFGWNKSAKLPFAPFLGFGVLLLELTGGI